MAKKTVFQDIDYTALSNLSIDDYTEFGIWQTNGSVETIIHTHSTAKFNEIVDLLEKETTNDLSVLKKGFLLPCSNVSADRIKTTLREHNITVTNDYEKADFIITHGATHDEDNAGFKVNKMLTTFTNKYMVNDLFASNYHIDTGNNVIWDDRLPKVGKNLWEHEHQSAPYDLNIVTGLALNLANLIHKGEMQVVDIDTVMDSSASSQMLTQKLADDLSRMLDSSNDDEELAGAIIPTISAKSEPAILWRFLCDNQSSIKYGFSRNKDMAYWKNLVKSEVLSYMCAEEAINHFIKEGTLTKKSFKIMEPYARQEITLYNREMYTFVVQLKPEYKEYLTIKTK